MFRSTIFLLLFLIILLVVIIVVYKIREYLKLTKFLKQTGYNCYQKKVITMAEELKDLMFPEGKPEPEEFIIALTELAKQINELRKD